MPEARYIVGMPDDIFTLNRPDYRKARACANKVLDGLRITAPPVPIRDIIEDAGLDVKFVKFNNYADEIAGFTDFAARSIYVNAEDILSRQTWTMAHEYGHWVMHRELFERDPDQYQILLRRQSGSGNDPREQEANAFARMILIPERLLRPVKNSATVSELASMFMVSKQAMENALQYV